MPQNLPPYRRKRTPLSPWLLVSVACALALVVTAVAIGRYGVPGLIARFDGTADARNQTSNPTGPIVVRPSGRSDAVPSTKLPEIVRLGSGSAPASDGTKLPEIIRPGAKTSSPVVISLPHPRHIDVIDGDTISADGKHYRLVGIDTPEKGYLAKCAAEREKAARASSRLRQIVDGGNLQLSRVSCHCEGGTEGTQACNYGRFCGVLTSAGRDVGQMLINEGLAKRYDCSSGRCPHKQSWCT
jgi:endonuclease YncB( thermonuclease family)